jgi:ABC-2 type transport system ATP-binding protein
MLKIEHLVKKYPNSDKIAVQDLSLDLRPGEIFGFLGKNGAGKSTTIKSVTGILPFDSGSINVCGFDIKREPLKAKQNMGYVPDNHSVYEKLTGREYVNYVADLYKVSREDRVRRLNHYLELFKLTFAVDRQIKSYSHGMKQKICIIAALIHEPKLWVLDEPMMGLDPQATNEIVSYMREHCRKGNTVFFSSHNLDLVKKLCHRAAIISEGKLLDIVQIAGRPDNAAGLEERFFRLTEACERGMIEVVAGKTRDGFFDPTTATRVGRKPE